MRIHPLYEDDWHFEIIGMVLYKQNEKFLEVQPRKITRIEEIMIFVEFRRQIRFLVKVSENHKDSWKNTKIHENL